MWNLIYVEFDFRGILLCLRAHLIYAEFENVNIFDVHAIWSECMHLNVEF